MIESQVISYSLTFEAITFLGLLLLWNFVGRYLQDIKNKLEFDGLGARLLDRFASAIHVLVLTGMIFIILLFIFSGTLNNPTDFRYVTF